MKQLRWEEFKPKVQRWAYANAFTLIFLSFMFVITWLVIVVVENA